ncbi:hypothetical protein [Oceaniglobus indicus]|uniref:hypothetical protein n=1 Tax=Oceaniglobus indicus TaxID=2047749 RepID=UPI000C17E11D|nr:hypothetical protein [Oceaniglobus indicus]
MDDREQREGEARVRALLVEQLQRLGLMRPGGMTVVAFDAMLREVCQRLAYMSEAGLMALAEVMAERPGGRGGDRFPLAVTILKEAMVIEPPAEDASPLIRKVFASPVGLGALDEGYAPELMGWLRANRRWPQPFVLNQRRDEARDAVRRLEHLETRLARGEALTSDEAAWRDRRRGVLARCERARDLGMAGAERRQGGA